MSSEQFDFNKPGIFYLAIITDEELTEDPAPQTTHWFRINNDIIYEEDEDGMNAILNSSLATALLYNLDSINGYSYIFSRDDPNSPENPIKILTYDDFTNFLYENYRGSLD